MADHGKYQGDKGLEYYKAYPRDFFEGTLGFDGPLKGFYRMVIDLIYMHDGFLLDDWGHIAGHTGFGITKCKRLMAQLIEKGKIFEEIDKDSRYFVNRRSKVELSASRKFQKKQANNSAARWENNDLADPMDDPTHIPPQDHKTTRQESPSDSSEPEKKSIFGGQQKKQTEQIETSRKKPAKPLPDDWVPDMGRAQSLMEKNNLTREEMNFSYQQMKDHAHANDRRQADWNACFATWVRNEIKFGKIGPQSKARKSASNITADGRETAFN